jgi:diguanylate cyclase (GGDEF)-like protein
LHSYEEQQTGRAPAARVLFAEDGAPAFTRSEGVPARAIAISIAALAVPLLASAFNPRAISEYEPLLWLLALVPAFLLAYYRGRAGVAAALAAGMAALSLAQAISFGLGRPLEGGAILMALVITYLLVCFGLAMLTDRLHRDRQLIERLALTDPLTGLANRRYTTMFLEKEFAAAQRGRKLSVILTDVDDFKGFNDAKGHAAGDRVLQQVAAELHTVTRATSVAARLGGDEFISIVSDCDAYGALIYANSLNSRLSGILPEPGFTVSIGIAEYTPDMKRPEELVEAADRALYAAKASGRNCVRVDGKPI